MKKTRLLFILPTLSKGGQERIVSRLSFALNNSIYEKYLVLFYRDRIDYPFEGKIISLDLPLPSQSFFKIYQKIFSLFVRIFDLRKIKNKLKPDFAISFGPEANIVNVFSNLFFKKTKPIVSVRIVESAHFKKLPFPLKQYYNFSMRLVYKLAEKIIPNSEWVKKDIIENFRAPQEKIFVIPNFLDMNDVQKQSEEAIEKPLKEIFEENKTLISIGRLTQQKGFSFLLEAFSKVLRRYSEVRLIILGEGELEKELKELSRKLNIEKNVYFLGFQKNPFKFLKRATIFIFPSLYEGFPNVLIEAMSCGLPVIATDCPGGNKEILSSLQEEIKETKLKEYGILVPPANSEELAKAILLLLTDDKLRKQYSERAKKRAEDFSVEKIIQKWENILKEEGEKQDYEL